jgi:hypothetical protein
LTAPFRNTVVLALALLLAAIVAGPASAEVLPTDNAADASVAPPPEDRIELPPPSADAAPADKKPAPADDPALRRKRSAIIAGTAAVVLVYGATVWWNDSPQPFHSKNEGWFGQDTYAGGTDKLGHAFFCYGATRLLTSAFESIGFDRDRALITGALSSFVILAGIEVVDGFSKKQYGFSKEDFVMDAAGVALGILMERAPSLDALLDFRVLFWPSGDSGKRIPDPVSDYSGQTYLMVLKADGVPAFRNVPVLKYFELAAGYGTRGYYPVTTEHTRNIYYGVSLNLSRLFGDTVFRDRYRGGKAQRATDTVLEYLQIPGTTWFQHHRL